MLSGIEATAVAPASAPSSQTEVRELSPKAHYVFLPPRRRGKMNWANYIFKQPPILLVPPLSYRLSLMGSIGAPPGVLGLGL
jgi:hypothetical protein